jgi:Ca2+-transporting ATPase
VHLPEVRNDQQFCRRLERVLLAEWTGCVRAEANAVTGNLLVVTSLPVSQESIRQRIKWAWAVACGHAEPNQPNWWRLTPEETASRLSTSCTGLTNAEAADRLAKFGPNRLTSTEQPGTLQLLLRQFRSLPSLLLTGSAVASLLTGGVFDAALIASVVAANAAIGFVTEQRAARIIEGFVSHGSGMALVRRNGEAGEIPAGSVVPGDVLLLMPGMIVPADARIIEAQDLVADESMLTGESAPVSKSIDRLTDPELPLAERSNMVFSGTLILAGQGLALVVSIGRSTEVGQINAAVAETESPKTPLQRRLEALELGITALSFAAAGAVFGLGMLHGQAIGEILPTAIALAIAAIPEGLPTTATVILARGLREMQRQGALIRRLDAVETLGSVNAICFDKTGTLTQNRMAVSVIAFDSERLVMREGRIYRDGMTVDPSSLPTLLLLMRLAVLCNESEIASSTQHQILNGSSTENALLLAAVQAGIDTDEVRDAFPLIDTQGRTEHRRYMATRHGTSAGVFLAVKGSPDDVLELCEFCEEPDATLELTEQRRDSIRASNREMAARGLRVLGFAYHPDSADDPDGLIWVGMIGLSDPLRPDMQDVIADFHRAGIRTVMITGDQAATARSIAYDLALSPHLRVTDGIGSMSEAILREASAQSDVFARITPVDKLRIVQALQSTGQVIAMTGDGSNDAPALRAADIGVALGADGTTIARETADLVLAGDDLGTMVVAVSQGRAIYANLRKSVHFLVGTNSSEILLTLAATAIGLRQPLNPAQLLWINLLTDIAIAVSLGFEPPEADLMACPPRDPQEPIIGASDAKRLATKGALFSASALAAHLYGLARYGTNGGGIGFLTLLGAQLLDGLSSRSQTQPVWKLPPNPSVRNSLIGILALQTAAALVPATRRLLGIATLDWADLGIIAAGSIAPFLTVELAKGVLPPDQREQAEIVPVEQVEVRLQLPPK